MADGDNQDKDKLAQAQAKIVELEKKIETLTADLEKKSKIVDNAEAKFNEMANETGENRKAVTAAALELIELRKSEKEAQKNLTEANKLLAEAKKLGPKAEDGNKQEDQKPPKTADEIEAGLSEAERKFVEECWKGLNEAQRTAYMTDEKVRKAALLEAKATVANEPPDLASPWKKPVQKQQASPGGDAEEIKKLFRKESNTARKLPDGSSGGAARAGLGRSRQDGPVSTTNILM